LKKTIGGIFNRKRNLAIIFAMVLMPLTAPFAAAQTAGTAGSQEPAKYIAIALAIGIPSVAAGLAIYGATTAGAAAMAERPEMATWVLIFAALGEGLAIYGLIVAIMLISA
jgi:V/A-type H+-transporting ATPase subunit K